MILYTGMICGMKRNPLPRKNAVENGMRMENVLAKT